MFLTEWLRGREPPRVVFFYGFCFSLCTHTRTPIALDFAYRKNVTDSIVAVAPPANQNHTESSQHSYTFNEHAQQTALAFALREIYY